MSKKLQEAIQSGKVRVYNKRGVEVYIWYRNKQGVRKSLVIPPLSVVKLVPELTEMSTIKWSNLKDAIKRGDLSIKS